MDDSIFGPNLPIGGGSKYTFNTAEELRRRRDNGGLSFEFDEARQNVLAALEEIEKRDRYLADLKRYTSIVFDNISGLRLVYEEDLWSIDDVPDSGKPFDPDWCVRPGDTLVDWREENKLTTIMAAAKCRMSWKLYCGVELGRTEIDAAIAACLEFGTGSPAGFWLERERHYREDKAKGKKDLSKSDIDEDGRYRPGR